MGLSCILTDNAAQFTRPTFQGSKYVKYLNNQIEVNKDQVIDLRQVKITDLPRRVNPSGPPSLIPPSVDDLSNVILSLYQSYDDIFIILASNGLYPTYTLMEQIVCNLHGRAAIHLIDSQSIAIGEGQIVQYAAEYIAENMSPLKIEERLREIIPHIYTLLCTPNLSYLHKAGFIDYAQATVGEMMSLLPIFALEEGILNPMDKVKSYRNVIDCFNEFIDEFDEIENVSLIHPSVPGLIEAKLIRQHMEENYPQVNYSEYVINPFLASLVGPRGMGIVITETVDR